MWHESRGEIVFKKDSRGEVSQKGGDEGTCLGVFIVCLYGDVLM